MTTKIHGPSIHSTETPGTAKHDQGKVIATTEEAVQAMKDGKLEVHPVAEFAGEFEGMSGTYKIFFAHEK